MDLCIEFGEVDPRRMIERLGDDMRLFNLWLAYDRREPFGYQRHNIHAAMIRLGLGGVKNPENLMIGDRTPELSAMWEAAKKARQDG